MEYLIIPLSKPRSRYVPFSPSCTLVSDSRYRTDLGKVLAGIQVPPNDTEEFEKFLQNLGYPYVEETENEVYKKYLRG